MMRAIVLACLAAGALAAPASAAHADRAAYVGRVNAICRSFTPKMQAAERAGKAAYAAGNAHRYAYELGIVLGLSLKQAGEVQRVPVQLEREGARILSGAMRQPAPAFAPFERVDDLLTALGAENTDLPVELYHQGPGHVFVELESPAHVAALRPEFPALAGLMTHGAACFARDGLRWKLRDFLPAIGIDEDPATGSAAGPLALHLARHGRIGFGDEIEITQGAEIGRPSTLYAVAHSPEHIEVSGAAVIVARGEFQF